MCDADIAWQIRAMYNANGGKVAPIAKELGIDKAKVRRILLIHGDLKTARTSVMYALYEDGASREEIAQIMAMSTATVARALPYKSDEKREGRGERQQIAQRRS